MRRIAVTLFQGQYTASLQNSGTAVVWRCSQCRYTSDLSSESFNEDELIQSLVQGLSPKKEVPPAVQRDLLRQLNQMDTGKASNTSAAQQHLPTEAVPTDPQRSAADVEVEIAHHSKVSKYPYGDFLKLRRIQSYNGKMRLEWMCTLCETYNFVGRVSCRQCNAHQTRSFKWSFPPTRHVATFPANWLCESCGHCNEKTQRSEGDATSEQSLKTSREFFFCAKCQVPFGGVRNWYCPSCDRLNTRAASQCTSCWEERPSSWVCKHCECATNSIFTVACRDCKKERQKKKSAYVVPCVCCNTPNDVRWEVCESCLAPLPAMKDFMNIKTEHVVLQPSVTEEEAQSTPPQQQQQISPYKKRYEKSESITSETGGAWWCANCNITHRRNVTFCDVCLEPRTAAREGNQREKPSSGEEQEAVTPTLSSGSWTCPFCRQVNGAKTTSCCGKRREVPPTHWLCAQCASVNHKRRKKCIGCNAPMVATEWTCEVCEGKNPVSTTVCSECKIDKNDLYWSCDACHAVSFCTRDTCTSCGAAHTDEGKIQICPVCAIPNPMTRLSCFRCKAHFEGGSWKCDTCGCDTNTKRADHVCTVCNAPRPYDYDRITWVCDICSTHVNSGGDLPEVNRCVLCRCERRKESFTFPTRWKCRDCGVGNVASKDKCVYCGGNRVLTGLHTTTTCPHCCKVTPLDESEVCAHCSASLQSHVSSITNLISDEVSTDLLLNPFNTFRV